MSEIIFFLSKGPFYLNELSNDTSNKSSKLKISGIKTLEEASKKDLTFFWIFSLSSTGNLNSTGFSLGGSPNSFLLLASPIKKST